MAGCRTIEKRLIASCKRNIHYTTRSIEGGKSIELKPFRVNFPDFWTDEEVQNMRKSFAEYADSDIHGK